MLVNHQQHQQLYASPQRELCIDTDAHQATGRGRRQQGRANAHTLRSRSQLNQTHQSRGSMYATGAIDYEHERPI